MLNQLALVYTPLRKFHLYNCDHRGLPLVPGGIPYRYDSNYLKQFHRLPCSNKR
ncbi:hypothetical protein P835_03092 [Citrobacter portucalensis]|nr:hypothetical protein P835_03092 [Citrobacter portucalensis]